MRISKRLLLILCISMVFGEDFIVDGETVYLAGEQYYDNVIIVNNGILSLVEFGGANQSQGKLILVCDSLHIDQSSSINGDGAGGAFGLGIGGLGSQGTDEGRYGGGGGGSHAGLGGIGGGDYPGSGGSIYGDPDELNRGSRGGYGYSAPTSGLGKGGGAIKISARAAFVAGDILANGQNAYYDNDGGCGGGSGGMIVLEIQHLALDGSISASGGEGAAPPNYSYTNFGSGGGGGGGRIVIRSESLVDTNLCSVEGGEGGDCGNGYPGLDGTRGEINYLKTWLTSVSHEDQDLWYVNPNPVMGLEADGDIFGYFYTLDQTPGSLADQSSAFTSQNTVNLGSLEDGTWYFHAVPMDDSYLMLNTKHMTYQLNIHSSSLEVTSPTHPEEGVWYDNPNPVFNFESLVGIDDYYYIFDQSPTTLPTVTTGTHLFNPTLIVPGNMNGTYYLHIVGMDESGFVGMHSSHFQVNIGQLVIKDLLGRFIEQLNLMVINFVIILIFIKYKV